MKLYVNNNKNYQKLRMLFNILLKVKYGVLNSPNTINNLFFCYE